MEESKLELKDVNGVRIPALNATSTPLRAPAAMTAWYSIKIHVFMSVHLHSSSQQAKWSALRVTLLAMSVSARLTIA